MRKRFAEHERTVLLVARLEREHTRWQLGRVFGRQLRREDRVVRKRQLRIFGEQSTADRVERCVDSDRIGLRHAVERRRNATERGRDRWANRGTPPITDPGVAGPFTVTEAQNVGPNNNYTTIAPMEIGQDGIKNPIVIWAPGAGAWPAIYQTLLNHIASHGFVIVAYNSTPQGPELTTAMNWIVAESTRQGSIYFGKIDTTKIAAAGQSAGSLAVFNIANDKRLTTTLHINGGTFAPHTGVMNLVQPAQFICGDDPSKVGGDGTYKGDEARPNCDIDFMMATTPVWYGDVIGASHTTVIDNPLTPGDGGIDPVKQQFLAATAAWLRWQLASNLTMKPRFVGPSCGFCTDTSAWTVQQKNLQ